MTGSPDWRIAGQTGEVRLDPSGVTVMSGANWTGRYERVTFGAGFHMNLGHVETQGPLEHRVSGESDAPPSISVWAPIAGRATLLTPDAADLRFTPWRAALFVTKDRSGVFRFPGPQTFRFFSVAVSTELFVSLLDGQVPQALRPLVESRGRETVVRERPIKAATRVLIGELGAPGGGGGALQRLHREAVALRLLTEVLGAEMDGFDASTLTSAEAATVRDAHEALLRDLREPPSAAELAKAARMGLRRFLRAFEALHGASPDRALRLARLAEARRLIETGELPMKEIAWRVGYAHASNFVAAFSAEFGVPPRRFQRRGFAAE
jgi:AraC-like DNA-binding protein